MTIPDNVKRGAALLDERLPNWRERVDLDALDLEYDCHCVLGQVLGSYNDAVELLALDDTQSRRHGFTRYGRQTFDMLTNGWRELLRQREPST